MMFISRKKNAERERRIAELEAAVADALKTIKNHTVKEKTVLVPVTIIDEESREYIQYMSEVAKSEMFRYFFWKCREKLYDALISSRADAREEIRGMIKGVAAVNEELRAIVSRSSSGTAH